MKRKNATCKAREELVRKHAICQAEAKRLGVTETEDLKRALRDLQDHNQYGHDGNRCPAN